MGLSVTREQRSMKNAGTWEELKKIGGGGQSDVFLVRSPQRVSERTTALKTITMAVGRPESAALAEAVASYGRLETPSDLGAMKKFKIRDEGGAQQAMQRLQQEVEILKQGRPGLPKLLEHNVEDRWIVTEYFQSGTVEDNLALYQGNPVLALLAFQSLVDTVAKLHEEGIVHRDIKPANVFVRDDKRLVLGDFGIVYVPDLPARLTRTQERVGPRDFMPPWADVGERLDEVTDRFDVYALGKLLWCMVSGRTMLPREYFTEPRNDLTLMYKGDPHVHMIQQILEKSVVERERNCESVSTIRAMVISFIYVLKQGGQLINDGVPRPCRVCGFGEYRPDTFGASTPIGMRFWLGQGSVPQTTTMKEVRLFVCDKCGHMQLFRTTP
jgi:serine/threonine protein kinase